VSCKSCSPVGPAPAHSASAPCPAPPHGCTHQPTRPNGALLVLDLFTRRKHGEQVPVIFPLASWNPADQDLYRWMEARLIRDHPGLGAPTSASTSPEGRPTVAQALLDAGLILPILDGLDEIADAIRGAAIGELNAAMRPGERLVLSSRMDAYRDAVRPPNGAEVTLTGAAGIVLTTLDTATVGTYLGRSAGGPARANRWTQVLAALTDPAPPPVASALATPLMVTLARAIYNPRPGERVVALPDPVELLDPNNFAKREDVEQHLFDGFIAAVYRPRSKSRRGGRWAAEDAERWLTFLARHLEKTMSGASDFAWWQLSSAVFPRRPQIGMLALGLAAGLVFGLMLGLVFSLTLGLVAEIANVVSWLLASGIGLAAGLAIGSASAFGHGRVRPAHRFQWSFSNSTPLLAVAIAIILGVLSGLERGLVVGLAVGLGTLLIIGFIFGLEGSPADVLVEPSPRTVLSQDRRTFWVAGLGIGLAAVFITGLPAMVRSGSIIAFLVALPTGLLIGLFFASWEAAWGAFTLTRLSLALVGRLPWRLMSFLVDAHQERGVLRQVGAVYQFRHLELQRRLAFRFKGKP
jgi:hypothetical protein